MDSDKNKSSETKKSRPLLESDLLKPWVPPHPHHPLNKLHPSVLPQIYGEKNRPLRASPPVWQKKVNLLLVDKLEVQLSLKELAARIELLTGGK
jgi:hypothetical protein